MYSLAQWSLMRAGYAVKSLRGYSYVNIHHHCYLFVFYTFVRILPLSPLWKDVLLFFIARRWDQPLVYFPFTPLTINSISDYSTRLPSVSSPTLNLPIHIAFGLSYFPLFPFILLSPTSKPSINLFLLSFSRPCPLLLNYPSYVSLNLSSSIITYVHFFFFFFEGGSGSVAYLRFFYFRVLFVFPHQFSFSILCIWF